MKSIAMFNNKGGVGKTTVMCNIASWISQRKRKKVLIIDADPQCNSSTYVLSDEEFLNTYYDRGRFTINDVITPLKTKGAYICKDDIKPIHSEGFGVDVIAGSPKLAVNEDFLSGDWKDIKAGEIRGIRSNMLFFDLTRKCAQYDYIFFDMGPSLGAINRAVLLACDYFVTPMSSDLFSILALENIGNSLLEWKNRFNQTLKDLNGEDKAGLEGMRTQSEIKFLGYIYQQYITKSTNGNKRIVHAYEKVLKDLPRQIDKNLIKKINKEDCVKSIEYELGSIPNFYSLIPMSQSAHKPVFALTNTDGVVGAHYQKVKEYGDIVDDLTEAMIFNMGELS